MTEVLILEEVTAKLILEEDTKPDCWGGEDEYTQVITLNRLSSPADHQNTVHQNQLSYLSLFNFLNLLFLDNIASLCGDNLCPRLTNTWIR